MSTKTTLSVFLVGVAGVAIYFGAQAYHNYPITNYPSSGEHIVAFGDSLVEGVGSERGGGFVKILSEKIGTEIINAGKSGDTTRAAQDRLEKQVLSQDPQMVLILLGGNDFLRRIPKEETFNNLKTIIDAVHEAGAVTVLLGVRGGILSDGYEDDFKELAQQTGSIYVSNVLEGLFGNPDLMYDGIHPNDRGYEIIAGRVYEAVKEFVH